MSTVTDTDTDTDTEATAAATFPTTTVFAYTTKFADTAEVAATDTTLVVGLVSVSVSALSLNQRIKRDMSVDPADTYDDYRPPPSEKTIQERRRESNRSNIPPLNLSDLPTV